MPRKLKDVLFSLDSLHGLADAVAAVDPQFDRQAFLNLVQSSGWEERELAVVSDQVEQTLSDVV